MDIGDGPDTQCSLGYVFVLLRALKKHSDLSNYCSCLKLYRERIYTDSLLTSYLQQQQVFLATYVMERRKHFKHFN